MGDFLWTSVPRRICDRALRRRSPMFDELRMLLVLLLVTIVSGEDVLFGASSCQVVLTVLC